uniref:Galactose-binding lectin n=1 Tax=Chondrilla caribensis TaxID=1336846 RepID=GLEC_CHOCI|nr:RecName: Full=Galactose-binding lectin; Short=CCL [Chondrilla caribensis]
TYAEVESFGVGQSATAVYTAPGDGRDLNITIDADGGYVIHMDYRFDWGGNPSTGKPWEDILILNSKPAQTWGPQQHVNNFYFTPGTHVTLGDKSNDGHFAIIADGIQVATYDHRLPVNSVKEVKFSTTAGSGTDIWDLLLLP